MKINTTESGSYIKKDKDHDVLGNLINPRKFLIPKEEIRKITIDGKKFFWVPDKFQAQCAKCLFLYEVRACPVDESDERQLYIEGQDCYCKQNENETTSNTRAIE